MSDQTNSSSLYVSGRIDSAPKNRPDVKCPYPEGIEGAETSFVYLKLRTPIAARNPLTHAAVMITEHVFTYNQLQARIETLRSQGESADLEAGLLKKLPKPTREQNDKRLAIRMATLSTPELNVPFFNPNNGPLSSGTIVEIKSGKNKGQYGVEFDMGYTDKAKAVIDDAKDMAGLDSTVDLDRPVILSLEQIKKVADKNPQGFHAMFVDALEELEAARQRQNKLNTFFLP